MRGLLTGFLLFGLIFKLSAQHTVSGIISDKSDKTKLLSGVTIYVPEFNKTDISKEGGTYIIRDIGIGSVTIQFTLLGYKTIVRTVSTIDSATVLSVEMEPALFELEEVAITANKSNLPENVPYTIQIFRTDEIKKKGSIRTFQTIAKEPGVDLISLGNGIVKPVIRGLSFNHILFYQYGTRIENQSWDDRHDMGINENGVQNIEIIKGPASLIYGPDAMGGTIVFADEKPAIAGTIQGDAKITYHTNTLGIGTEAGLKGTTEKGLFYSFRMGLISHTSYIQGEGDSIVKNTETEQFASNSKFNTKNMRAVVGMTQKWGVSKLTYSLLNQKIGIIELEKDSSGSTGIEDESQREREMEAPYQDVTSNIISLENTILMKKGKINFNAAFQVNNRKEFEPMPDSDPETAIGLKLNVFSFDLKYSSDPEKKTGFIAGGQGMSETNRNFGTEELVPDADVQDFAPYLLFRYDLPKWNFLAGGRSDFRKVKLRSQNPDHPLSLDQTYESGNGSIGAAFHPGKKVTLKLNGSSGFTSPNYAQLGSYGKHEGAYRFEAGNENLVIEQNFETDFSVKWESRILDVQAEAYYNMINNYIYIANTGGFKTVTIDGVDSLLPFYEYRQQNATLSGGEISVDIHPTQTRWIELSLEYGKVRGTFDDGDYVPYIPAAKFVSSLKLQREKLDYIIQPYISIVFSNYFKQDEVAEFETPSESYSLIDFHVGGDFKWGHQQFGVALSVSNLLNKSYESHLSLVKNIGVKDMGRDISIHLTVPFGVKNRK